MEKQHIKINEVKFRISDGKPFQFQGKHSKGMLSGINLEFTESHPDNLDKVDELLTQNEVQVYDPFTKRSYKATINRELYSYQAGEPEVHYVIKIKEVDLPPTFDKIEIEGYQFKVVKYLETDHENDAIGMHALLILSKAQFKQLQSLLDKETVLIKRNGVDEKPIELRYGGVMYWSRHEDDNETYYKHIVRFFPLNLPPPRLNLASGIIQVSLAKKVYDLSGRFEALLNELVQGGLISSEKSSQILEANLKNILDKNRLDEMLWEFYQTADAEEEF